MVDYNQLIADYSEARSTGEGLSGAIVNLMKNLFEKGNVDLLSRPVVSGMVMNGAGWDDVDDDDYATVYTLWYARGNDGQSAMWMDDIILHVTPIKSNGTVETPTHLDEYVDSLLAGTNSVAGLLEADKPANGGKGLVICVQKANDGWTKAKADADIYDIALHQLQAAYYMNDQSDLPEPNDLETIADWFHVYSIYIKNYKDVSGNYITDENRLYSVPINPGEENIFIDPKVTGEMGKAGSFEFSMLPGHPYYESLCQMKTILRVTYDGDTIFRGRVLTIDTGHMNGMKKIHCEGDLAFLLDSQIEGVSDNDRPKTDALSYMNDLIAQHNAQMAEGMADKRFSLGEVPGSYTGVTESEQRVNPDANYRYGSGSWRDSQSAWDDLANSFGGFVRTRYQNGTCFLDWLDQYYRSGVNPQVIELGNNLLELTSNSEVNNIFTAVIPVGSGENGKNLYINGYQTGIHGNNNRILVPQICQVFSDAELNKGFHSKSDYQNAVNDYGIIYHTEAFSNADTQAKLWEYATDWIKNNYIGGLNSFNVSALDMHVIGQSDGKFLVGDKVIVRYPDVNGRDSDPDAVIEKTLTVMKATYDLYHPEKNTYEIGIPNAVLKRTYGEKKNKKSRAASSSISSQLAEDELKDQAEEIWKESKELFDHETIWSMILTKAQDDPLYRQYEEKYGDKALAAVLAVPETILYESQYDSPLGEQSRKIISGILSGQDHTINLKGPINQAALQESGQLIDALVMDGLNHGVTVYQKPLSNAEGWKLLHPDPAAVLQAVLDPNNKSSAKLTFSTGSFEQAVDDLVTKVSAQMDGTTGGLVGTGYKFGPLNIVEDILDEDAMGFLNAIGERANLNGGNGKTHTFDITGMGGTNNKSGRLSLATIKQGFAEATESFKTVVADGETGTQALAKQVLGSLTNSEGDPEDIDELIDGEKIPTIVADGVEKTIEVGTGLTQDSATVKLVGDNGHGQGQQWIGRKQDGSWRIFLNDNVSYTDVDGKSQNAYGFVTADDFKIKDTYNSLKSKLLVVDQIVAGKIDTAMLNAFKAEIDELYAKQVDVEGMLTADSLFSGSAYTGHLQITPKAGVDTTALTVNGHAYFLDAYAGDLETKTLTITNGFKVAYTDADPTSYDERYIYIGNAFLKDGNENNVSIFGSSVPRFPDIIDADSIIEDKDLEDGKIGFKFKTYADSTYKKVNFKIADTAYYKDHVGIKEGSLTSLGKADWLDPDVGYNSYDARASLTSLYGLVTVTPNDENKPAYKFGIDATGVLSDENIEQTDFYKNNVGINTSETSVIPGDFSDWTDWDFPSADRKSLTDIYGKVTITANDGSTFEFGIDATDVYEAGVREGEGNVDTDAAYTSGYRTGYSKAQTVTGNDARVSAYVEDVVYDDYTNYAASINKLQISLKAYPKLKFKKLQNDSDSIEPDSWDATPTDGTLWQDTVEFPMEVSPVELYKESFDGSKFVVKSVGNTGWVKINGEEIDVPLKDPLEIPISGSIDPIGTLEWHDKEGDPYRYQYTFKLTGTIKSNNDTLADLKRDDYINPSLAISYGKSVMGISSNWETDNKVTYSVAEGGSKSPVTLEVTAAEPSIVYNDETHEYTVVASAKIGSEIVHNSIGKSTGDKAYQDGLTQGRSESQTVYGEITDIDFRDNEGEQYSYNDETNTYKLYLRASGRNLSNTNNWKDADLDFVPTEAYEEGRKKGKSEVTPVTVYGKITKIEQERTAYYNENKNLYSVYARASGTGLDPDQHPNGYYDQVLQFTPTEAVEAGQKSVKVTAASISASLDVYDGDYTDIPVDVTLNNGKKTTLNVDMSPIYQAGLDGDPEITEQEFEFEFVDDDNAYIVVDDPYFKVNVNGVYQNGVRDSQTAPTYWYAYVWCNPNALYKRVTFYKVAGGTTWGYLQAAVGHETEVMLLSDTPTVSSGGYEYYEVLYDGFPGYIASGFINTVRTYSLGDKGGWYNDVKPTPSVTSIKLEKLIHLSSYGDDIKTLISVRKGSSSGGIAGSVGSIISSAEQYVQSQAADSSEYYGNTVTDTANATYLKEYATGYFGKHSVTAYNGAVTHRAVFTVTYDTKDVKTVVIEFMSQGVNPTIKTITRQGIYHSDNEYSGSISVAGLGTSEAMRYFAYDSADMDVTPGESIGTYITGSFTHSSYKYNAALHHKVMLYITYDFDEPKSIIVACSSTAKTPTVSSVNLVNAYHSSSGTYGYRGYIELSTSRGTITSSPASSYDNIATTGDYSSYFTGNPSYAYNANYPSILYTKFEIEVIYSDDTPTRTVIVEGAGRRKADPGPVITKYTLEDLIHNGTSCPEPVRVYVYMKNNGTHGYFTSSNKSSLDWIGTVTDQNTATYFNSLGSTGGTAYYGTWKKATYTSAKYNVIGHRALIHITEVYKNTGELVRDVGTKVVPLLSYGE